MADRHPYHWDLVYGITAGHFVKIGFTADIRVRYRAIQQAVPERAVVRWLMRGDRTLEKRVHAHLAAHRVSGEWFRNVSAVVGTLNFLQRQDLLPLMLIEKPVRCHLQPCSRVIAFRCDACRLDLCVEHAPATWVHGRDWSIFEPPYRRCGHCGTVLTSRTARLLVVPRPFDHQRQQRGKPGIVTPWDGRR